MLLCLKQRLELCKTDVLLLNVANSKNEVLACDDVSDTDSIVIARNSDDNLKMLDLENPIELWSLLETSVFPVDLCWHTPQHTLLVQLDFVLAHLLDSACNELPHCLVLPVMWYISSVKAVLRHTCCCDFRINFICYPLRNCLQHLLSVLCL